MVLRRFPNLAEVAPIELEEEELEAEPGDDAAEGTARTWPRAAIASWGATVL